MTKLQELNIKLLMEAADQSKPSKRQKKAVWALEQMGFERDYIPGYDDGEPPVDWDRIEYEHS